MAKSKNIIQSSNASSAESVSEEMLRRMIAEAAYYIALARGFAAGDPVADWLTAEREISSQISTSS